MTDNDEVPNSERDGRAASYALALILLHLCGDFYDSMKGKP
ncbi:hypothetical protein [Rugamonas sp.]|nr:hypothetical protein [Rugamonas sp.]